MSKNALDKMISYFSPEAGARRVRARLIDDRLSKLSIRKYDAAASGRRTDGWVTSSTSANAEIQGALGKIRDRSRDLVRNDPHAKRAVSVVVSNTIGAGIIPKAKSKSSAKNKSKIVLANSLWKEWGVDSFDCDFNGQKNIYGLQAQALRCVVESGEVLVRKRLAKSSDKLSVPVQIQLLEPDFIDTYTRNGQLLPDGAYILQGKEYDKNGKVIAYYLYDSHPGEQSFAIQKLKSNRIPANEVIHLYDPERIGQVRGIPWGAAIILKLRDFNDYDDAQLLRQKIAACFTAFVHQSEGEDIPTTTNTDGSALIDKLEPGTIEILPDGKDIKFASPPSVDGYADFSRGHLRQVAIGFGITYESLTGDYSQVNYSSARMAHLQMQNNITQWQSQLMIPGFCGKVWNWFSDSAIIAGYPMEGIGADWTPPRREYVDPYKEITAKKEEIRNGLTSLSEAQRENGYDPDELLEEIASDNKKLDDRKIILDCDARQLTNAGMVQPVYGSGQAGNQKGE